ncbi:MAG: hypothetical protein HY819_20310 [Acidobacteria bacterium]|nr:hypothetical protein [Acidobacteriota bacterium]
MEKDLIDFIAKSIELTFNAISRVETLNLDILFAYDQERKQYNSTSILAYLKPNTEKGSYSLAITKRDLYTNNSTFVFGEAEVGGRVGIVSLARLSIDPRELYKIIVLKEVTHELGHILGLRHCETNYCVMSFSTNLKEVEQKSFKFCPDCAHSLVYLAAF